MPLQHKIETTLKRVVVSVSGRVTREEFFTYQRDVWTRPDVAGLDELVDLSEADEILGASAENIQALAGYSSEMDTAATSRLAIVAPGDLFFGLGRMYEAYRESIPKGTRKVAVFRTRAEAEEWLASSRD